MMRLIFNRVNRAINYVNVNRTLIAVFTHISFCLLLQLIQGVIEQRCWTMVWRHVVVTAWWQRRRHAVTTTTSPRGQRRRRRRPTTTTSPHRGTRGRRPRNGAATRQRRRHAVTTTTSPRRQQQRRRRRIVARADVVVVVHVVTARRRRLHGALKSSSGKIPLQWCVGLKFPLGRELSSLFVLNVADGVTSLR